MVSVPVSVKALYSAREDIHFTMAAESTQFWLGGCAHVHAPSDFKTSAQQQAQSSLAQVHILQGSAQHHASTSSSSALVCVPSSLKGSAYVHSPSTSGESISGGPERETHSQRRGCVYNAGILAVWQRDPGQQLQKSHSHLWLPRGHGPWLLPSGCLPGHKPKRKKYPVL